MNVELHATVEVESADPPDIVEAYSEWLFAHVVNDTKTHPKKLAVMMDAEARRRGIPNWLATFLLQCAMKRVAALPVDDKAKISGLLANL